MTSLHIEGMHCGGCADRVNQALRSVPGVTQVNVSLTAATAQVEGTADAAALVKAVENAGYRGRVLDAKLQQNRP